MDRLSCLSAAILGIVWALGIIVSAIESEAATEWPTSDLRLDVASGGDAIDISPDYYNNVSDGVPMILSWYVNGRQRVEPSPYPDYVYQIVNFDRRWGYEVDRFRYLTQDQVDFIGQYNRDFFDEREAIDGLTHATRFRGMFRDRHPDTGLGSYISGTTCVASPQSLHSPLEWAGNTYPASMLDCCEIVHNCPVDDPVSDDYDFGTVPWPVPSTYKPDGKWFLPFDDHDLMNAALVALQSTFAQHQGSSHIFFDNGWYPFAMAQEASGCQEAYLNCITTCEGSEDCLAQCDQTVIHSEACHDSRTEDPNTSDYTPLFGAWPQDLFRHYENLMATTNRSGFKAILNMGTIPSLMGNYIEGPYLSMFEDAMGTNGISFEQPLERIYRMSPQWAKQAIEVNQRLLARGMLIVQYVDYQNLGRQLWTAAMALSIRQPGQSLFVARSPRKSVPTWVHWPALYGGPISAPVSVQTTCDNDCMQKRGGQGPDFEGDWYIKRRFENGQIVTSSLNLPVIELDKAEGDTFEPSDLENKTVSLVGLLGGPLNHYDDVFHPAQYGRWESSSGLYKTTFEGIVEDFWAKHCMGESCDEPPIIMFPDGATSMEHKMDDFFVIATDCQERHCPDMIAVAVQLTLRINKLQP